MTAQIITFADRRVASVRKADPGPRADTWNHPINDDQALTRVLLHRIAINLRLPLKAEDYGFLHRYGHLRP